MAGSFLDAFAQSGLVNARSASVGADSNQKHLIYILGQNPEKDHPLVHVIAQNEDIPLQHRKGLVGSPLKIGSIINAPVHKNRGVICAHLAPSDYLITGSMLNRSSDVVALHLVPIHDWLSGVTEKSTARVYKSSDIGFTPTNTGYSQIDFSQRMIVRIDDNNLHNIKLKGMLAENMLADCAYSARMAQVHTLSKPSFAQSFPHSWVTYHLSDLVSSTRPHLKPGYVVGCYFPDLPETGPGAKLRPAVIVEDPVYDEKGQLYIRLAPSTTKTHKNYPQNVLIDANSFSQGKIDHRQSNIVCMDRVYLPLNQAFFDSELLIYGQLKHDVAQKIYDNVLYLDGINRKKISQYLPYSLPKNSAVTRDIAVPVLANTCRI